MVDLTSIGTLNLTMTGTIIMGIITFGLSIYTVYLNWVQARVDVNTKKMITELEKMNVSLAEIKAALAKKK